MTSSELQTMDGGSFPVWERRKFHMKIPDWAREKVTVYSQNPYLGIAASVGNARTALFPGNKELFPAGVLGLIPYGMGPGVKLTDLGKFQVHYRLRVFEKIPPAFNIESSGAPVASTKLPTIEELVRLVDGLKVDVGKIPTAMTQIRRLQDLINKAQVVKSQIVPEYSTRNENNQTIHNELKRDVDIVPIEGGQLVPIMKQSFNGNSRKPRSTVNEEGCCQIGHDGKKAYIKCDSGSSRCPFRFPSLNLAEVSVVVDFERAGCDKILVEITSDKSFRSRSENLVKELPARFETDVETKEIYSISSSSDAASKLSFCLDSFLDASPFSVFIKWDADHN